MSTVQITKEYMEAVAKLKPEHKCYCCWHLRGKCPHCPYGLSGANKVKDRGNDQPSSVCKCNDIANEAFQQNER